MLGQSTRERKIRFMDSFGTGALLTAVKDAFHRYGHDWLTDEQLDEIIESQIADWRATQKMNRRNREIAASRNVGAIQ